MSQPTIGIGTSTAMAKPRPGRPARADPRAAPTALGGMRSPANTLPITTATSGFTKAYVLDRDDLDLYGRHVALDFVARIERGIALRTAKTEAERKAIQARIEKELAALKAKAGTP